MKELDSRLKDLIGRGRSIEIGGKSEEELERLLQTKPFHLRFDRYAPAMMRSIDFNTPHRTIQVARVSVADLGFTGITTTEQMLEQITKLGLDLLPAEAGPYVRLQDTNQPQGEWYYIAMNPITAGWDNIPRIFRVGHHDHEDGVNLWLDGARAERDRVQYPEFSILVGVHK